MSTENNYCIAMTTAGDEETAATLARGIVEAQLGACVQIVPIRSFYVWEGQVNDEAEQLLLVKTRSDRYADLEAHIREHHSYDVPEIIRVPITGGSTPYLAWIDDMTKALAR